MQLLSTLGLTATTAAVTAAVVGGLAGVVVARGARAAGSGSVDEHRKTTTSSSAPRAASETPTLPGEAHMARLMLPDDANPAGNVHGGVILQMVEQTSFIVATRHCNSTATALDDPNNVLLAATARFEHMDFLQPVFVGNVLHVHAKLVYCSPRSMMVVVRVEAEDLGRHQMRHTNTAKLWYVALEAQVNLRRHRDFAKGAQPVPSLPYSPADLQLYKEAEALYQRRKLEHEATGTNESDMPIPQLPLPAPVHARSPADSRVQLSQLMLPSDCAPDGTIIGGRVMLLMDSACGIVAARHCRTNVVTISVEAMDFIAPIFSGYVVFITAELVFTSARMMEIEVIVEAEHLALTKGTDTKEAHRYVSNRGLFKFVSINKENKSIEVPPLLISTEEEHIKFSKGQRRYDEAKARRQTLPKQ